MVKNANCDGVTITGGDPLEQPEELLELLKLLYSLDLRKGIILFTGYTIDEINNLGGVVKECLGYIDLLIDGRFEDTNKISSSLKGSGNQQFFYFSSKIKEDEVLFDQEVELHLRDDILLATGFPQIDRDFLLELGVILD
jgi:anaerobic ribonucleoside-triphosphate reductase activating protein